MCKLLAVVDIENVGNAERFLAAAKRHMTAIDSHGLGVVRLGPGGLAVQRWLNVADYPAQNRVDPYLSAYRDLLPVSYNEQGNNAAPPFALGMHSRFATCARTLENVHPFVREGIALIHNGVITNHSAFKKEVSSCDSEALLASYIANNVSESLDNVQLVADEISGSYAFMVFHQAGFVDIIKDDSTDLCIAHVTGVGTVFCTKETIIRAAAKAAGRKVTSVSDLPPCMGLRWKPGEPPHIISIMESPEPAYTQYSGASDKDSQLPLLGGIDNERCEHNKAVGEWCPACYEKDMPGRLYANR